MSQMKLVKTTLLHKDEIILKPAMGIQDTWAELTSLRLCSWSLLKQPQKCSHVQCIMTVDKALKNKIIGTHSIEIAKQSNLTISTLVPGYGAERPDRRWQVPYPDYYHNGSAMVGMFRQLPPAYTSTDPVAKFSAMCADHCLALPCLDSSSLTIRSARQSVALTDVVLHH